MTSTIIDDGATLCATKGQFKKDTVWKSAPLEQELLHRRSQDGH
jgi:hypothetical protein